MTDAGAPLSRRERRERERRNAAPEFDDLATGETEARGGEGRTLSRRERRALERTMHPMETWTAEEEMLATGQLPAMTPDVIAAEERNARERAEQAALEAQATSSELSRADIERERARAAGQLPESEGPERLSTALPSPSADTEPAPEPAAPQAPQAPGVSSPASQSEQQSAAPAFSWPEPQSPSPANAPAAATSEPFTWPAAAPEAPQSAPGTSEPDVQGKAPAWPTPDSESVLPQPAAQAPAPVVETEVTPPAESSRQRFTGLSRPTPEAATSPAEASYAPEATHGGEQAPGAHDVESAAAEQVESTASAEPVEQATASPGDAPASQESADDPAADSAAPTGVAEADPGALPDILKDLFPAGSPQARMMEEGAAYARAQAEHPVARTPIPLPETATPADSEPPRDAQPEEPVAAGEPAETIAADPQAAVAPPEAQHSQPTPTPTPTQAPTQAPRAEDPAAEMRRLADEAMANLMNAGTSLDSHTVDDAARAAGEAMAESRGEVAPHDRELPEGLFHDAPATPTPAAAQPFVNLHGDSSTTQVLPPVAPFGQSAVEPAESATGTAAPAPSWEQGNLQPATPAGFNPDDYVPSSDIPLPDLSALEQAAHPNTASGANGSGEIPYVAAPVTDGIEVPRREVPQLQPGHGARDMHWAHFLVIGAVAFVLGLLVYQLAGLGS